MDILLCVTVNGGYMVTHWRNEHEVQNSGPVTHTLCNAYKIQPPVQGGLHTLTQLYDKWNDF